MDRCLGYAERIRVRMPGSAIRHAWDCRPFGLGRVVAPCMSTTIDLAEGIRLNLANGELRADASQAQKSA